MLFGGKLDGGQERFFMMNWVVVSNIVSFHPYLGKVPILTSFFQRG